MHARANAHAHRHVRESGNVCLSLESYYEHVHILAHAFVHDYAYDFPDSY